MRKTLATTATGRMRMRFTELRRIQQLVKQIVFGDEHFDVMSVRRWRDAALRNSESFGRSPIQS